MISPPITSFKARSCKALVTEIQSGLAPKWLFFWGHTPSKDDQVSKSCFSQWNGLNLLGFALMEVREHLKQN